MMVSEVYSIIVYSVQLYNNIYKLITSEQVQSIFQVNLKQKQKHSTCMYNSP